jgi:hypothetical protein
LCLQCLIHLFNFILQPLIVLFQVLVLSPELYQFLENIRNMFFRGRASILFKFEVILQPFDLGLQVMDNILIFDFDPSLIVFFAYTDTAIKIVDDRVSFSVKRVNMSVLDNHSRTVSLCNTINNGVQVCLLRLRLLLFD